MKLELLTDFECGEVPSLLETGRASRLEHWQLHVRRRGKEFVLVAEGLIFGHPEFADGTETTTGALVWVDRQLRFCRSFRRLYMLCEHSGNEIPIDGADL
ncbi:hypothetical protein JQ596_09185 [Bradyrhizobium manausense]|uniref:hypothetical protein n=1 Tax=Bradyrhizobium TaxID=374 RepID=UPI001BA8C743|nr:MULTISPECIES: hypothetical protein [Bradyrhizobium]MBR0825711.1 hypothetical protein [Bradyrhizobium manausense]UVO31342.1 hypothetical protein KUF59_12165 [Bradyrhizobium arachidis]